jgi:predicted Zn-dependent peptidase
MRKALRVVVRVFFGALVAATSLTLSGALLNSSPAFADDSASALADMVSKVRFYTLKNGLKVILYNRGSAPVFAGAVVVRVGGSDETVGDTGISHLFEHMAFKGTRTIGTTNFAREKVLLEKLEAIAAASRSAQEMSADQKKDWEAVHKELRSIWVSDDFTRRYEKQGGVGLNATTDKEFTKYFINLPRSAFELWCQMESDRLINPVMRQFYQERDVVLEERRMRFEDSPGGKLYELLLGIAYQRHPYRDPVIGYEHDIRQLTATKLEGFRRRFYNPRNMVVSVVGRVNPDEDIKLIEEYFGAIPDAGPVTRDVPAEVPQQGERRVSLKLKASPELIVAYQKPNYPHPDDAPISVAAEILAGGRISPLYVELVKRRQLAAAVDSEEGPGVAYPNLLMFAATPKAPHTPEDVLAAFDSVIARFTKSGPTEEQLLVAQRSIGMDYLAHLQSNQSLALDLASAELVFGTWKASVEWYDKMKAVTLADVKRVSEQYLSPERRTVATIER